MNEHEWLVGSHTGAFMSNDSMETCCASLPRPKCHSARQKCLRRHSTPAPSPRRLHVSAQVAGGAQDMDSVRRIRVEFEADLLTASARAQGLNRSWYRPRTNAVGHDICGLARALISDFALTETRAEALRLEVDGFTLPPHEAAGVLRDGDTLHVRRAPAAAGVPNDTPQVRRAGAAGDSEPKLPSNDKKRSRSARRKAALRARRREARAGSGAAAAAALVPAAPGHGQHSRGGPPAAAAAAAPAPSTDESDSDDEEDEEAAEAPEPDVQPAVALMPHFMAWAQGSPSPAPGSIHVAGQALASGQVVSVRLVELLPSGCVACTRADECACNCARHLTLFPTGPACHPSGTASFL